LVLSVRDAMVSLIPTELVWMAGAFALLLAGFLAAAAE